MAGKRAHVPTPEQRRTVESLSAYGIPQLEIARLIGVTKDTLRMHYRDEMDLGMTKANAKVAECLFRQASVPGNIAATLFWMKTRMGWRETNRLEVDAQVDAKVRSVGVVVHDYRQDPAMVAQVARVLLEAGVGVEEPPPDAAG